jgi:hypothetical protein
MAEAKRTEGQENRRPGGQKDRRPEASCKRAMLLEANNARLQGGPGCQETTLSGGLKDKKRPGLYLLYEAKGYQSKDSRKPGGPKRK